MSSHETTIAVDPYLAQTTKIGTPLVAVMEPVSREIRCGSFAIRLGAEIAKFNEWRPRHSLRGRDGLRNFDRDARSMQKGVVNQAMMRRVLDSASMLLG